MSKLLLNEFKNIFNRKTIKYVVLTFILLMFASGTIGYLVGFMVPTFLAFFIVINSFFRSQDGGVDKFFNSLPIKREDVVYSKYIFSFIVLIGCVLLSIVLYSEKLLDLAYPLRFQDIVFSLSIGLLILSFIIPINLKYEYRNSRIFNVIILIIFMYLGMSAFYGVLMNALEYRCNMLGIGNVLELRRTVIILFSVVIGSLIVYLYSMKLSLKLYLKKDIG